MKAILFGHGYFYAYIINLISLVLCWAFSVIFFKGMLDLCVPELGGRTLITF